MIRHSRPRSRSILTKARKDLTKDQHQRLDDDDFLVVESFPNRNEVTAVRSGIETVCRERLATRGDAFEESQPLLERAGLDHYREVSAPPERTWQDPWTAKLIGAAEP